jgi:hypothetical protein
VRDRIALLLAVEVAKAFESGDSAPTDEVIAGRIGAPVRVVHELSYQLVSTGILRQVYPRQGLDPGLMPARDLSTLTARDVLAAIRNFGDPCALPASPEAQAAARLVDQVEQEATGTLNRTTIKALATVR